MGILAEVTGFPKKKRILIRNIIVGGYFLISSLLIFIIGCIFLGTIFGEMYIGTYILDWILITIPCLTVILGIGNVLGKKSHRV